jgi:L-gulonate 5-dehydrogenase
VRQVVTVEAGRMAVRESEVPEPGDGDALLRVEAIGLCGSDYHLFDGTHPYARFPQVQGHEFTGIVERLPRDYAGGLGPGDRVVAEPLLWCGTCFACRRGRTNCCESLAVMGAHVPGGLTDYAALPADRLHPTGDLPALVAVLAEPFSIGLHAVRRGQVGAGDQVLVVGAGPIGLTATLSAVDAGAQVLVADRIPSRLEAARRFGAAVVVDTSSEDLARAVASFTGGAGVAVAVEATGVPSLVRTAVDVVAQSGTVVVVGISLADVAIPVSEFSRKEISLLGARNSAGEFPAAIDLISRHAGVVASLVTHVFGLDETPAAIEFAMAHPAEVEKVVITTGAAEGAGVAERSAAARLTAPRRA